MAKSKRSGKAHVSGYARYKNSNSESTNRIRKLNKLIKLHPNNEQLPLALKNVHHRRKTPAAPSWTSSTIRMAKVLKQFTGKFDKDVLNPNSENYQAAIRARNPNKFKVVPATPRRSMFTIGERLGWKF